MGTQLALRDDMPLADLGGLLAKSGYFADAKDAAQAVVKVLAGREMGFGPIASMTGIYIVKGRVSLSANLMAAAVRRSGRYTFLVRELTEKSCSIEFFEVANGKRESIGVSAFSLGDAQRAGTQNLDKFPRNMLYARAMSNGVKWFCPDVTGGPIYTPEELGETVNEDGEIIDSTPALAVQSRPMTVSEAIPPAPPPPDSIAMAKRFDPSELSAALDWLAVTPPTAENNTEAVRDRVREIADRFDIHLNGNAKTLFGAMKAVKQALEDLATK